MESQCFPNEVGSTNKHVISPGRPRLRTTFRLLADIPYSGHDENDVFLDAIKTILLWINRKYPVEILEKAWKGEGFEQDVYGQRLTCVNLRSENLWTLRLNQPDAPSPYGDREAVAGRSWTTDIALKMCDGGVHFGVKIICSSLDYCTAEIVLTRPRVVIDLADSDQLGLYDVRRISKSAWRIANDDDLNELYSLIVSKDRTLAVVILTEPNRKDSRYTNILEFVLDHEQLAKRLEGIAHVVLMPFQIGFEWTKIVGKQWSAFNGAIRVFNPSINFDADPRGRHPLILLDRIIWKEINGKRGEDAFAEYLVANACEYASKNRMGWGDLIFVPDAKLRKAQRERDQGEKNGNWKEQLESENVALKGKLKETEEDALYNLDCVEEVENKIEYYSYENHKLRLQIDSLRNALERQAGENIDNRIETPQQYDDLPDWVDKHFAGRLELHGRTRSSLKNAAFEDVQLVCNAIIMLANEYRDMKTGCSEKANFDHKLNELHLSFDKSITNDQAGQFGDEYYVDYLGQRRLIEFHLKKGNSRDSRYCLRIYFIWDDDSRKVVVCSLPGHLRTKST